MAIAEILVLPHSHFDHGFVHPASAERILQVRFWKRAIEHCRRKAENAEGLFIHPLLSLPERRTGALPLPLHFV
jgi:hypothetical protein